MSTMKSYHLPLAIEECETRLITDDGIALEALYYRTRSQPAKGSIVVCHPNPAQGGTMHHKVVTTTVRASASIPFNTVRFNFRGVERSEGVQTNGEVEERDVLAACDFSSSLVEHGQPTYRVLAGFSFGSAMAVKAVLTGREFEHLLLIAPPLAFRHFPVGPLPLSKVTLIVGDHDQFCPVERAQRYVSDLGLNEGALRVVEGGDHFFHRKLDRLADLVCELLGGKNRQSEAVAP